ncbi:branched-chain-amino-acid aminotransferase-like protein 1 [Argentina anserina]|uniref:branched-chain-amino-acid aminotransferase-like protein 1 n=1 Tax=Argentina anserina TaxID=57926 RepID=UPI00217627F3|nr:branched-chain-amino-acid aminotransferase-like protein 1 [Potentilla anserina]
MADRELHLLSAFLAMEPIDSLIGLARECGGGSVTEGVQRFIWDHCITKFAGKLHAPYVRRFLKKLIAEVELNRGDVIDELYEHYVHFMSTLKENDLEKDNARIFSLSCLELSSCLESRTLIVQLQCSLNMLEGDTGCSVWPSSLLLSECILSFPELFSNKSCFEVGSGVGLVGICLAHVKASKVNLTDGDLSTLANMKLNMELNHVHVETDTSEITEDPNMVKCIHLPWESVSEKELGNYKPDIILGADVIHDPVCLPHLVRVLNLLLNHANPYPDLCNGNHPGFSWGSNCSDAKVNGTVRSNASNGEESDASLVKRTYNGTANVGLKKHPMALIASVIRNVDTFNKFLVLLDEANLTIEDLTESLRPLNFLSYMKSYDRSTIHLFSISCRPNRQSQSPLFNHRLHFQLQRYQQRFHALNTLSLRIPVTVSEFLKSDPIPLIKFTMAELKTQGEVEVEPIHLWATPRSLSTSLMYSFAQRDDIEVLDEPLYATFLRVTGFDRPYREEVLSQMESDGNKVVNEIILGPGRKKYRFCKHIAKQRVPGLPSDLMNKGKHLILTRNPLDILPSFGKVVPPSLVELGFADLVSIYSELSQLGRPPLVIDAAELQEDAEGTLRGLCEDLDIPFQSTMLKWEAGPKQYDGIWAPWWYESVHKSTYFQPSKKYPTPFPFPLYDVLEQSLPFYNFLRRHMRQTSCLLKSGLPDPKLPVPENKKLLAWVGDEIVPRESAKVSVFDSVVQGGDSVWEGLRVYQGTIFKLEEHLDRLFDSAKALAFSNVPTRQEVKEAIFRTLIRNGMFDNSHIRLSLTRGKKVTSGMSPAFNLYGCTLIVLAEWKPPVYDNTKGITLVTATTRRNSPNNLDSKIHHNNLLNNILAKIEGNNASADDAIMLDKDGYVSETNATNIFLVKRGRVLTPHADYCLPGVTRATVMDLVVQEKFPLQERNISLSEFHTADEVWTTGTMGELSPVVKIDGRLVGDGKVGPVTRRLQNAYKQLTEEFGVPIPTTDSS